MATNSYYSGLAFYIQSMNKELASHATSPKKIFLPISGVYTCIYAHMFSRTSTSMAICTWTVFKAFFKEIQ
jgi:hypothetical protein